MAAPSATLSKKAWLALELRLYLAYDRDARHGLSPQDRPDLNRDLLTRVPCRF